MPPVPAFYHHPKTIEDLINQTVGKVLDLFSVDAKLFKRWGPSRNNPLHSFPYSIHPLALTDEAIIPLYSPLNLGGDEGGLYFEIG